KFLNFFTASDRLLAGSCFHLLLLISRCRFLTMIAQEQISQMSLVERLRTMELLCDSISRNADQVRSPAWHGEVLAGRLARIKAGQATFLTLDQVKRKLRKRQA